MPAQLPTHSASGRHANALTRRPAGSTISGRSFATCSDLRTRNTDPAVSLPSRSAIQHRSRAGSNFSTKAPTIDATRLLEVAVVAVLLRRTASHRAAATTHPGHVARLQADAGRRARGRAQGRRKPASRRSARRRRGGAGRPPAAGWSSAPTAYLAEPSPSRAEARRPRGVRSEAPADARRRTIGAPTPTARRWLKGRAHPAQARPAHRGIERCARIRGGSGGRGGSAICRRCTRLGERKRAPDQARTAEARGGWCKSG